MTLNFPMNRTTWQCSWFAGKELQTGVFSLDALKKVEPSKNDDDRLDE